MTSSSSSFQPARSSARRNAGAGPMPIRRGSTPAEAQVTTRASGSRPCRSQPAFAGEQQGGGAVVERAGVAGRHRAVCSEHGAQRGEPFETGVGARPLVDGDVDVADPHGDQLAIEETRRLRGHRFLVAADGEAVLRLAADRVLRGEYLGGHAEADRVLGGHLRVDQPPTERCVDEFLRPRQPVVRPRQHERRSAHRLHAAGHGDVAMPEGQVGSGPVERRRGPTRTAG